MNSTKLNAAGIRWVAELADYNFKLRYRPGKIIQDCDYLSRYPSAAETHTNEEDFSTLIVERCLSSENNLLSVSSVAENNLENRLNLEPENETSKINDTLLKAEQEKDLLFYQS